MTTGITKYRSLVFDCDGVILDSNAVKSEAFRLAVNSYGERLADEFVEYHRKHGGVSRYKKFRYFLEHVLGSYSDELYQKLLTAYADIVKKGLLECDITLGLDALRQLTPDAKWLVASGGDQNELREIFEERRIDHYFDGGIYGSPTTKEEILGTARRDLLVKDPGIFLGDSLYDYEAAKRAQLDFMFVSNWTELANWQEWVRENSIKHVGSVQRLLSLNNI